MAQAETVVWTRTVAVAQRCASLLYIPCFSLQICCPSQLSSLRRLTSLSIFQFLLHPIDTLLATMPLKQCKGPSPIHLPQATGHFLSPTWPLLATFYLHQILFSTSERSPSPCVPLSASQSIPCFLTLLPSILLVFNKFCKRDQVQIWHLQSSDGAPLLVL